MVLTDEARYLAAADLYVLTPQMLDVVIAAAQSLTFADLSLLRDDLPSPSGVVILPRPVVTRLPTGSLHQDIAFTWHSPWWVPLPGRMGFRAAELPAVRMSGYVAPPARSSRRPAQKGWPYRPCCSTPSQSGMTSPGSRRRVAFSMPAIRRRPAGRAAACG
jgi:hypothetical protein